MYHKRFLAAAIAATLLASTAASAAQFSQVIVFGDSLSDAGNISLASDPSIQPPLEFTTNPGSVIVQNIANHYGYSLTASLAGGTDYAWGGAGVLTNSPGTPSGVPTITDQVNAYLAAGSVNSNALYSMWGGANDIFYAATSAGAASTAQALIAQNVAAQIAQLEGAGYTAAQIQALTPSITTQVTALVTQQVLAAAGVSTLESAAQAQASIIAAAQQEVKLIGQLQAAGVKNMLVFNLPNIGLTPDATEEGASAAAALTGLSGLYNGELNAGIQQLGRGVIPVNTYALLNELIANPSAYGFTNVTTPACGVGSSSVQCGPQGSGLPYTYAPGTNETYLFADGVHPTLAADRLLSQAVLAEIAAPGQVSLLSQAPLTAITTQTQTLRQEMLYDGSGSGTRMFAHVNYSQQSFDASATSPKANSNNFNLTLGSDLHYSDNISMGAALGLGHSNTGVVGGTGGYVMQDISALAYITYHSGGGYAGAYGEAGHAHFTDVDRTIQLGPMTRTESGSTGGSHGGLGVTGGWWFGQDKLQYGPFANVEWHDIGVSSYQESGNDSTAMWFANQNRKALISTVGARMQGEFQISNAVLKPFVELSWNHDSKADPSEVTAGLTSMAGSFTLTGYVPDKTWGMVNVGLTTQLTPSVSSWVGYTGRFSDTSQRYNNINMGFKILL